MNKIMLDQAYSGNKDAQFFLGKNQLEAKNPVSAERWLRYAAIQNHPLALKLLKEGISSKIFISTVKRLDSLVIELWERFIIPAPSIDQIRDLGLVISNHI